MQTIDSISTGDTPGGKSFDSRTSFPTCLLGCWTTLPGVECACTMGRFPPERCPWGHQGAPYGTDPPPFTENCLPPSSAPHIAKVLATNGTLRCLLLGGLLCCHDACPSFQSWVVIYVHFVLFVHSFFGTRTPVSGVTPMHLTRCR